MAPSGVPLIGHPVSAGWHPSSVRVPVARHIHPMPWIGTVVIWRRPRPDDTGVKKGAREDPCPGPHSCTPCVSRKTVAQKGPPGATCGSTPPEGQGKRQHKERAQNGPELLYEGTTDRISGPPNYPLMCSSYFVRCHFWFPSPPPHERCCLKAFFP